jgi:hypothetical protein
MPMELHHFNDEVPGSSPGGSNMRGHSSMVERAVSSKPCRRALRKLFAAGDYADTASPKTFPRISPLQLSASQG